MTTAIADDDGDPKGTLSPEFLAAIRSIPPEQRQKMLRASGAVSTLLVAKQGGVPGEDTSEVQDVANRLLNGIFAAADCGHGSCSGCACTCHAKTAGES